MRFCTVTLGCKVNQFETQALASMLTRRGHTEVQPGDGCDVCIVNTCAVTAESGRKSRQAARRMKTLEPHALVAVCGCFSQLSPDDMEAELVAGSGDRTGFMLEVERLVRERAARRVLRVLDDPQARRAFEVLPSGGLAGRTRAMLKIQDGCDNYCAYCVIPYARGPARSMPADTAAREAARLAAAGYREIVVTGIEISSYGRDLGGGTGLLDAVTAIARAAENARVRLGSLEPRTVTDAFARGLEALPNLCDHFHLSLQSGCNATLARMRRRYTCGEFLAAVGCLRERFPDCGVTADLIVGFPGETDAEFAQTLDFIGRCAFSDMHIFPFSRRPGTAAHDLPGQLPSRVKRERAALAARAAEKMKRAFIEDKLGKIVQVLFEREQDGYSCGHAGNYLEVRVRGENLRNRLLAVRALYAENGAVFGEIV